MGKRSIASEMLILSCFNYEVKCERLQNTSHLKMLNRMMGVEGTDMMKLLLSVGVSAFLVHLITMRQASGNTCQFLFARCVFYH